MTHQDWIIIIATLSFASTFGVYVAIKKIIHYTSIPENSLQRRSDIELMDYIQPTQPQPTYNNIDLESQFQITENVSNFTSLYPRIHSYWSGTPPSYHTVDRYYINCSLENNINQYFNEILGLIFLSILIAFIFYIIKYFKETKNKTSVFLYIKILLILTFFDFTQLMNSLDGMSLLFPFSLFEIDFRDSFEWKFNSYRVKPIISYLKILRLTEDIRKLLDSLNDDENYSMGLSWIHNYKLWEDNKSNIDPLIIDNPIIINKESDPILITQFIMNKLDDKCYFIIDSLFNDNINSVNSVILVVCVPIKVEI